MPHWNSDRTFSSGSYDTGNIAPASNATFKAAPWGRSSWGMVGGSFQSGSNRSLSGQRYYTNGSQGYLFGREARGSLGFVSYVQGSMWHAQEMWCVPPPLRITRAAHANPRVIRSRYVPTIPLGLVGERLKRLRLHLDLYRGDSRTLTNVDLGSEGSDLAQHFSRIMYAINVWISSPEFPALSQGGNFRPRGASKPLVLDLAFYRDGLNSQLISFADRAYHYQTPIGVAPLRSWRSWDIDLTTIIQEALLAFSLPVAEIYLYELSFVIELRNAEGSAMIDNFYLFYD